MTYLVNGMGYEFSKHATAVEAVIEAKRMTDESGHTYEVQREGSSVAFDIETYDDMADAIGNYYGLFGYTLEGSEMHFKEYFGNEEYSRTIELNPHSVLSAS